MERTAERHQEHYCWVKIVAPADDAEGGSARSGKRPVPPDLRRAFDSVHLLKKMADGDGPPPGGERPPPVPPPPPPPGNPPTTPPPPGIGRAEFAGRRRPAAWRIERGSKWSGGFGMEVSGVSGDRDAAWQWIESEDGRRWRAGAVGVDLVLFTSSRD
jgi:hypothetical protein